MGVPREVFSPAGPWIVALAAACSSLLAWTLHVKDTRDKSIPQQCTIASPRSTIAASLTPEQAEALPYPLDYFPGARDIGTPYGSVRVYEWGPEDGPRILFVHGISLPCVSLGDLAGEFAERGYRVMIYDLYGRGYSDAPRDVQYDSRLYTAQMLFVLQSSPLNWMDEAGFHLIGYSLGGALSVPFARSFPDQLRSLTLITPGGIIRPQHLDWKGKLLYKSSWLPDFWVKSLVRRRIAIPEEVPSATTDAASDLMGEQNASGSGDASGGSSYDFAPISKHRPHVTVNAVLAWQMKHHHGFVDAFISTMSYAPIYQPSVDWMKLASVLAERRRAGGKKLSRILIVLGATDPIILKDEVMQDAERILGKEHVSFAVLDSGHEVPITKSGEVADSIIGFWDSEEYVL